MGIKKLVLMPPETRDREERECIPMLLQKDSVNSFLLKGRRILPLEQEVLLSQANKTSAPTPIARIEITEYTHRLIHKEPYTSGIYEIKEVL